MMLLKEFFNLLKPSWRILDLGAGEGNQAKRMVELGMTVVAVDKKSPKEKDEQISWNIMPVEDWVVTLSDNDLFDAILARNSLQFFDKTTVEKELLPILSKHLKSGGLFEIETFYKEPIPPFANAFKSLWTVDELTKNFGDWEVIASDMRKENTTDLSGNLRDFYTTGLLLRKP